MFKNIQSYQVAYFVVALIFAGLAVYHLPQGDKIQIGLDVSASLAFFVLSFFKSKSQK